MYAAIDYREAIRTGCVGHVDQLIGGQFESRRAKKVLVSVRRRVGVRILDSMLPK